MADERHSTARPTPSRVLLIESETLAREVITEALGDLEISVARGISAEGALRIAGAAPELPPAVLVAATEVPAGGMDGITLAGEARRRWPDLGVVYVTGRPSRLDGHVLGPRDRFLPKTHHPGCAGASRARAAGRTTAPGRLKLNSRTSKGLR